MTINKRFEGKQKKLYPVEKMLKKFKKTVAKEEKNDYNVNI